MIRESHILLFSIFIAGLCSIVYELLIATTSSYFLGDSITQFSLTIGIYMAFMGIGSYCSRWVSDNSMLEIFIGFELILALFGGTSVPLLYAVYASELPFQLFSLALTALIGLFIGLEIPLLSRLMEKHYSLKANISNVLSIDYFGALIATLVFPFILLPWLGIFKTSLAFGLVNLSIALVLLWYFIDEITKKRKIILRFVLISVLSTLVILFFASNEINKVWNTQVYDDRVVYTEQTPYQQIAMTKYKDDVRLFLNGGLQFSSIDEYRYHESLVHPAMARLKHPKHILILGGGDGLAVRELLKYSRVENITLVDLDPAVSRLAKTNHYLTQLNKNSLNNSIVNVINEDAFVYMEQSNNQYDLILIDLPDPKTISLARLYSKQFYLTLKRALSIQGILVTQATSPFFAKQSFWSIHNTIKDSGFAKVIPYHVNVPSFGEWGFVLACKKFCKIELTPVNNTRFYDSGIEPSMMLFSNDMKVKKVGISTLDDPKVLYYYLEGWKYWN